MMARSIGSSGSSALTAGWASGWATALAAEPPSALAAGDATAGWAATVDDAAGWDLAPSVARVALAASAAKSINIDIASSATIFFSPR